MKALKTVALILLAALFSIACDLHHTTDGIANKSGGASNANKPAGPSVIVDNANSNSPANTNQLAAATTLANASSEEAAVSYKNQCATCHGPDGKGNPAMKNVPDFSSAEWQKARTDNDLGNAIKKGRMPGMPAFESRLNEDQIRSLVSYIRSIAKK